ncbi:ParB/RepB/Spo0J family partition protein [Streptomyces sp. NPDC001508]|uniref:ParB/RepB/Spo0J family partition protein n=1 Tax=Streptomyces sp. NPDC001508 TaxID=3154656 RepID=UPI0033197671
MSKADQLGAGRFGGGVRSVSARRQAVAAATGVPTEGVAPPTELPPNRISLNPDNPRSALGDLTDLAGSLKTHGQKQAITIMNRDAYVKANPDREADIEPDAAYVVIDGSSRLAAAREAGLAAVKVMVSDEQGATSEELLESALVANIHRQDLEELDEARALQRLLAIHGSQRALAKRLHRSQGWVSQRLSLLNLTPELQARIREESIELLRAVGNRPHAEQAAALEELKAERARKEAEKAAPKAQAVAAPVVPEAPLAAAEPEPPSQPSDYVVITQEPPAAPVDAAPVDVPPVDVAPVASAPDDVAPVDAASRPKQEAAPRMDTVPQTDTVPRTDTVPEPRGDAQPVSARRPAASPPKLPYDDGTFIAMHLIKRMGDTEFDKMLHILNEHQRKRDAEADGTVRR